MRFRAAADTMVKIFAKDDKNNLAFAEGYIPDIDTLRSLRPRAPPFSRDMNFEFTSKDEATAWLTSAIARRVVGYRARRLVRCRARRTEGRRYNSEDNRGLWPDAPLDIPFDSWVIGPSHDESGRFASWFVNEPPSTNYRLMFHRHPRFYGDYEVEDAGFWEDIYLNRHFPFAASEAAILAILCP